MNGKRMLQYHLDSKDYQIEYEIKRTLDSCTHMMTYDGVSVEGESFDKAALKIKEVIRNSVD
jgi:hypothetical protein